MLQVTICGDRGDFGEFRLGSSYKDRLRLQTDNLACVALKFGGFQLSQHPKQGGRPWEPLCGRGAPVVGFPKLLHHWLVGFPPRDTGAAGLEAPSHCRPGGRALVVSEDNPSAGQVLALFPQRRVLSELLGSPLDQPPGFGLLHEPLPEVPAAAQFLRCLFQDFRLPSDGRGHDLLVRFELLGRILQGPPVARHGLEDDLLVRFELLGRILQGQTVHCHGREDEGAVAVQMLCCFSGAKVPFSKRSQDLSLLLHGVGRWGLPRGKGLSSLKQRSFRGRLSIQGLGLGGSFKNSGRSSSTYKHIGKLRVWDLDFEKELSKEELLGALIQNFKFWKFWALEGVASSEGSARPKMHFCEDSDSADATRASAARVEGRNSYDMCAHRGAHS